MYRGSVSYIYDAVKIIQKANNPANIKTFINPSYGNPDVSGSDHGCRTRFMEMF